MTKMAVLEKTEVDFESLDRKLELLTKMMEKPAPACGAVELTKTDPWVAAFDGAHDLSNLYWQYRKIAEKATVRQERIEAIMLAMSEYCPARLTKGKKTIWTKVGDTLLRVIKVNGRTSYDMDMLFKENPAAAKRRKKYTRVGKSSQRKTYALDYREKS